MTREQALTIATRWADAWNERDIERVLGFFGDGITFTSPTALAVVGSATVQGKDALRAYWNLAMSRIESLRFKVERVLWDEASRELAIVYIAEINGSAKRVSENLTFGDDGLVVGAEVFHGAPE